VGKFGFDGRVSSSVPWGINDRADIIMPQAAAEWTAQLIIGLAAQK